MSDEKREIRKMINEIAQNAEEGNYATNRNSDELCDYVTYVRKRSTGLSKDIIVDCGENYKYYNHPLCVYVVEDDDISVYPITVSTTPQAPFGNNAPSDIIAFIQNSVNILKGVADIEIGAGDFFNYLHEYRDRNKIDGDTFKAQMLKLNDVKVLLDSELNKTNED